MAEAASRAQAAADEAKAAAEAFVSIAVDWTKVPCPPFRKAFLEGAFSVADVAAAAAKRTELNISVESDAGGSGAIPAPLNSFSDLAVLPAWMHQSFTESRWDVPMPVQAQALPILLAGRNLIGIAQTGSGKTGAFLIPAIVHAHAQRPLRRADSGPVVLVVAPTRELAVQISDEADKLLRHSWKSYEHRGGLRSVCFYGGGRKFQQLQQFTFDGSHIVVATPGRLIDFCKEGKVSLQRVTYFCLDEADRMLDMGFSGDMDEISKAIRPDRQTVFFSATWPKEVQQLACNLCMDAPILIRVGRQGADTSAGGAEGDEEEALLARESIEQQVCVVDFAGEAAPWDKQDAEKRRILDAHIKSVMAQPDCKMIIFVNQKNFASELSEKLWNEGVEADAIHGGRPQETRLSILDRFRKGETRLLIATDVIGRGLDIPKVSHVVVYNMSTVEDYVHRIGRTGRGKDAKGHALVFFEYSPNSPDTAKELISVLQKSKQEVPPPLARIAQEVATGVRQGRASWGRSGSSDWKSKSWKDGSSWSGGDWKGSGGGGDWGGSGTGWKRSGSWNSDGGSGASATNGAAAQVAPQATTLLAQFAVPGN